MYAKQFESYLCTYIYKINIYMFGIVKYLKTEESPEKIKHFYVKTTSLLAGLSTNLMYMDLDPDPPDTYLICLPEF